MCTKNGSYCEKEKKSGGWGGDGGQGRCEWRSHVKLLCKFKKKYFFFFFFFLGGGGGGWGRVGGGGGGVRVDVS